MAIDTKLIMKLREATGMGIANCKKALEDSGGDFEAAELALRKQGLDKAAKKADRPTGQGVVAVRTEGPRAAILELACEQEPTTNNERFAAVVDALLGLALARPGAWAGAEALLDAKGAGGTGRELVTGLAAVVGENVQLRHAAVIEAAAGGVLGQYVHFNRKAGAVVALALSGGAQGEALKAAANDLCMHSVAARPIGFRREDIPEAVIAREREVFLEEVKDKPEAIRGKIVEGKLAKFYAEKVLPEQLFVKDPAGKATVRQMLDAAAKAAGGGAEIAAFVRMELGH
jgi:elongation factor Ts